MIRKYHRRPSAVFAFVCLGLLVSSGCSNNGGSMTFVDLGSAPAGGAFFPVGNSISDALNEFKGENSWKVSNKSTRGSQENIRRLEAGELQLGMSNSAITHFACVGGATWEKPYTMRAVVTIAPNVAMFITRQDSGIKSISDLKGKRVVVGPEGAGFEMFVGPIIEAHGVTFDDFTKLSDDQNNAVNMLADGQADAAFLGGAVPTASVTRACNELDILFVPFDEQAVENLLKQYPFFSPITVAADRYSDLTEDFKGLNVGSMHVITSEAQDEETIYQITKTIWENRSQIDHPACKKFINEENAARYTGTPFHPGAIRFYKEIGIWKAPEAEGAGGGRAG